MKRILSLVLASVALSVSAAASVGIVPNPVSLKETGGSISAAAAQKIKTSTDRKLGREAYTLTIDSKGVSIRGGSDAGIFWAMQTLGQIKAQNPSGELPCLKISDSPAFPYRGLLLDCSRHFFTVDEVKSVIDMMVLHKLNVLHWHITDDQGWRLEIKSHPELTEKASIRNRTKIGHYFDEAKGYDDTPYGGFYTQDEARDIVAYAQARHITVIPEIEMPGHSQEVLAVHPEFGCTGGPYEVRQTWSISRDPLCVAKPGVVDFLKEVLDEVLTIFPSEYINIGGDEVLPGRWEACPDCRAYMRAHGMTDVMEIQRELVGDMERYLLSKGRKMIGWGEIFAGCTDPSTTVISWKGPETGIAAANKGMHSVMCPERWMYLDYYQTPEEIEREPLAIHPKRHTDLEKVYGYDPLAGIPANQQGFISGVQGNIWTEYIATLRRAQHMALPRLAAVAEIAWSGNSGKTSFAEFKQRVAEALLPIYDARGYNYATYEFEPLPVSEVYPEIGQLDIYHEGWIDLNKNGVKDVYEDASRSIDERIENLLSQMTLEEKTCQMATLYGYKRVLQDDLPTPEWSEKIWKDGIGAIDEHLNGFQGSSRGPSDNPYCWPASKHAWALNKVQEFFIEQTRLGIPVDFTNEGIRGVESYIATNFPTQLGIGHTWDRGLVREIGRITGREGRLLGYTNIYAPILDVGRDQRWGRYEEVYGESPYLVAELGVEMVKGLQEDFQVASTGKHFLAYSNNKGGREGMARTDPQMPPHEVENIHVYPWREVIGRAGMLGAMSCYNDYDGTPVQGSDYWLMRRLRGEFGFKGYVVSDSDAVEYLYTKHNTAADMKEAVRQSVLAGLNVRCTFRSPDSYILPLRELVEEGRIPMSVIDDRVRDILRVKFLVGAFDRPYQTDYKKADMYVNCEANAEVALRASREALVLLKNDGTLPLDRSKLHKVAVIGPNADEDCFVHAHYGPSATEAITVLEGIRTKLYGRAEVVYAKGCEVVDATWPDSEILPQEPTKEEQAQMDEALAVAGGADVIIAVLGGTQRTCGENRSRSSIELPGHQNRLLARLIATGKPVVVVLVNGRPLSVNYADKYANAILEAWYPGSFGGTAVADALFGDYNPGGKLSVTFPKSVGQIPFNFPYKPNSQVDGNITPGPKGDKSRVNGALYDFGYGLSYTTFEYSALRLSSGVVTEGNDVEVSFDVTNTGSMAGDEIVQLYLHDRLSSITVYEKVLRGFERIHLVPGQTRTVTLTLRPEDFSLITAGFRRVVEPGVFDIYVGASSKDIRLVGQVTAPSLIDFGKLDGQGPELASKYETDYGMTYGQPEDKSRRLLKGDDYTFPMDRVTGTVTVTWAPDSNCDFEIQVTNGGGLFNTVCTGSVNDGGIKSYYFPRTNVSEARVLVTKGAATIYSAE